MAGEMVDGTKSLGGAVEIGGQSSKHSESVLVENPNWDVAPGMDMGNKAHIIINPNPSTETNLNSLKKPCADVLKPKVGVNRMKFEYHSPEVVDGRVVIKPPLHIDVQGRKAWENCLVGYFFEKRVAYHVMNYVARRKWSNRGLTEVIMNEDNFFFFKFATEQDLMEVLEEGVCMVEGKPLILQRWYPQIVLSKEVPKFIPL